MSSHAQIPATGATPREDPVRQGLADPAVARQLLSLVRAALGRYPAGLTYAQRQAEAEELFQEVSRTAITAAARFDPDQGSLIHWLGGIAWNLARQRRPARMASTEPATLEQTVFDASTPVPDGVANRLDSSEILASLPPEDARLLTLHAEGWTAPEIAARLDLTPGNVRVRLCRLIKRVQGMFPNVNPEADHD
jgi:RNA polymerase sigma factor (sigma-70 family)